ncbi:hypothetical protein [Streptomyces sp. ISID311]|uniref:hypothetical protein n=1 Tax=Streptomyces sp. ISID311 TaxID=2601673 RepID=UPI0011BD3167|nr:hypothetical protein [Streptomyces sp. ISID311]TXC99191.1 hypothetical protein FS847_07430 [Streptomyces sp. ISID311]
MRNAARRLAGATGILVIAGALPLVATAPAQATTKQCTSFLAEAGYKVGPKVRQACGLVGTGGWITRNANVAPCQGILELVHVKPDHAGKACYLGTED